MIKLIVLIILALIFLSIWPFCLIWAINTLFNTTIPFTVWTWLAAFVLTATVAVKKS